MSHYWYLVIVYRFPKFAFLWSWSPISPLETELCNDSGESELGDFDMDENETWLTHHLYLHGSTCTWLTSHSYAVMAESTSGVIFLGWFICLAQVYMKSYFTQLSMPSPQFPIPNYRFLYTTVKSNLGNNGLHTIFDNRSEPWGIRPKIWRSLWTPHAPIWL